MTKRNFILLIIVLVVIVAIVFGFLYFTKPKTTAPPSTEGTNFGSNLTPFGSNPIPPKNTPPTNVSGNGTPTTGETTPKLQLTKVSSMPVAGFGVFQKERFKDVPAVTPDTTTTTPVPAITSTTTAKTTTIKPTPPPTEIVGAVRYVARATGNIYETFDDTILERQFSTTVIPQIYEALFGNNGNSVIMRYLKPDQKTIETFVGALPAEVLGGDTTGDNQVTGSFLPENVSDVSISDDTSKAFYIFNSGDNSAVGTTYEFKTAKKVQVFSSPFTEWLSSFPNAKLITLTTKPSSTVPGYMYSTSPISNQGMTKVLGNINGLTTLASPNGKLVLYADNNLSLSIYHMDTRATDSLNVRTLPEKCVWSSASDALYCAVPKSIDAGDYPDSWYKGEVSFADQIWKINVTTDTASMVIDPAALAGGEIDGIKLALSQDEAYLFFVNKKDSYLWELNLNQ